MVWKKGGHLGGEMKAAGRVAMVVVWFAGDVGFLRRDWTGKERWKGVIVREKGERDRTSIGVVDGVREKRFRLNSTVVLAAAVRESERDMKRKKADYGHRGVRKK